jgi:hypothetical protein
VLHSFIKLFQLLFLFIITLERTTWTTWPSRRTARRTRSPWRTRSAKPHWTTWTNSFSPLAPVEVVRVSNTRTFDPGSGGVIQSVCPQETFLTGGGYRFTAGVVSPSVLESGPISANSHGWAVRVQVPVSYTLHSDKIEKMSKIYALVII